MDPLAKNWHSFHRKNLIKRESTHSLRLEMRRLGKKLTRRKSSARLHLKVPENLSIVENYEETMEFINSIKRTVFEDDLFIFLDFSGCKSISSETCVVLAAEIDRCKRKVSDSVTGSYPSNPEVYFFLNEIGFFELLKIRASKPMFDDQDDIQAVRLQSGSDAPEQLMKGMKELFYKEDEITPHTSFSLKVYRALTEAMGNAVEHAYPASFREDKKSTCLPIWWRAGFKLKKRNAILIILYDQGAGIPNTLKLHWKEKLENLISILSREPYDHEKIDLAMEKGRSRTKVEGRGQGSFDMQSLIRASSGGVLSIYSYYGAYSYTNGGHCDTSLQKNPLSGTLVIWSMCLDTEESTNNAEEN
jgi:hypothetical protein